jgi:hypothetical protein
MVHELNSGGESAEQEGRAGDSGCQTLAGRMCSHLQGEGQMQW